MTGVDPLPSPDDALRKSHEVIRALDQVITSRRDAITAADGSLDRAGRVLQQFDVDLVALEDRAAERSGPLRVLIVDDNRAILQALRIMVSVEVDDDVEVRTEESGESALPQARWEPDLVILVWQMPGMDGLETARHLRQSLPDARIVVYSAAPGSGAEATVVAAGADRYVEKGTDSDALLAEVRRAAARRVQRSR
jgi:CheY-like chemotaxis protein